MKEKKFKVLSLDGGGIRGIFSATILAELEKDLKAEGKKKWQIYQNVNLIFGTSTGGILGLALSLGIPAEDIRNLYLNHSKDIFGSGKGIILSFFSSKHNRSILESLLKEVYSRKNNGKDPLLKDCKVPVGISVYNLGEGTPSVIKSDYHPNFRRDPNLPVFKAALATSAAPTFFDPYSGGSYLDSENMEVKFHNKIDGGVWANNPSLIALIEAQKAFKKELSELSLLSLGTGYGVFMEKNRKRFFGLQYWAITTQKRIIEIFMQGQSQQVENLISLLKNGIDKGEPDNFGYLRLNTFFKKDSENIAMDETDLSKLKKMEKQAKKVYKENKSEIYELLDLN